MDTKLRTAWTVAAVLAILLIAMTIMWARASGALTLDSDDLARQSEKLDEACGTDAGINSPACREALDDLSALLGRFSNKLERESRNAATSTMDVRVSTTTAQ